MTADLIVMRLVNMTRMHPRQNNSFRCSLCGERVGIYPSGQSALKANPGLRIICEMCGLPGLPSPTAAIVPAAPWREIAQESRDSKNVRRER